MSTGELVMRLSIISDLHYDINGVVPPLMPADVLVIAGDVSQLNGSLTTHLSYLCDQFPHVVYVTGNHEYYRATREMVHKALEDLKTKQPNFHWLHNSTATIEGQRFVGTTLWFPETVEAELLSWGFTDFTWIKNFRLWWGPENTSAQKFLTTTIQATDIVVTHHAPSRMSTPPRYRNDRSNVFYVCEMDQLIHQAQPKLWLHGHMHSPTDYMLDKTRILCNPYGYTERGETATFNPALIVKV